MQQGEEEMAVSIWIRGMRPRTLPASIAPVLVGAAAAWSGSVEQRWYCDVVGLAAVEVSGGCDTAAVADGAPSAWFWMAFVACLIVALALQIAVNFANDYSDGIRGTDAGRGGIDGNGRNGGKGGNNGSIRNDANGRDDATNRNGGNASAVGPARLVASGVNPKHVLAAAGIAAAVACVAGLVVIIAGQHWWLLAVGVAALAAGWFYTGGKHPYGYAGWGEAFVFVFFGLVATVGTRYAITGSIVADHLWTGAIVAGLNAVALLMINNIRDIPADRAAGKRTYAARVGLGKATTSLYMVLALSVLLSLLAFNSMRMRWGDVTMSGVWLAVPLAYAVYVGMCVRKSDYRRALGAVGMYALLSSLCWVVVFIGYAQFLASW
ncbi:1,4-dihydroxy-2-naphthoate octaprenyltransferase [Bifidobacterium lemurum]|nr:1,4-dihydroxy-2-naphthoate octaprenyltransferase [Bifidobacterium lemurum]